MKLHYAATKPDWERSDQAQHNKWQRLAARTGGIVTPGNAASAGGICLVGVGLVHVHAEELWTGLILVSTGRLCDVLDGIIAERTGTKSPLGEAVDAGLDKIAVLATLIVFAIAKVMPWPLALIIGLQNGATSALALAAKGQKRTIHPAATGKIGTTIEWVALLGLGLAHAMHGSFTHIITAAAYGLALIAILLNLMATSWYAWSLRSAHEK